MTTLIPSNIQALRVHIPPHVKLICVSKFHPAETVMEAYNAGERDFGESRVQELAEKHPQLPGDIRWHFIGHLQTNKIKYIIPFVSLIHGVDSPKLLAEINKQAQKAGRKASCLLQIHIAEEESKFGFSPEEAMNFLDGGGLSALENVQIAGLMGMATFTEDETQIRNEFRMLKNLFETMKQRFFAGEPAFCELSMGMSSDYRIAIEEGSTMVRIGTSIFGERTPYF